MYFEDISPQLKTSRILPTSLTTKIHVFFSLIQNSLHICYCCYVWCFSLFVFGFSFIVSELSLLINIFKTCHYDKYKNFVFIIWKHF